VGVVRSCEQILQCGLRKFRHSKSSVYRLYIQFDRCRFVYDTWDNGSRLGRVMDDCTLFMTHCLRLNLQIHTISLVRTCRISSFCTVAWQLARLLLTRRIVRSPGDSWGSCFECRKFSRFWSRKYLWRYDSRSLLPFVLINQHWRKQTIQCLNAVVSHSLPPLQRLAVYRVGQKRGPQTLGHNSVKSELI